MSTWFRVFTRCVLPVTLAASLGACSGDGGANAVKIFFGANGNGACDRIVVTVDLEAAGAELERDNEGVIQCALDELLADDGCDVVVNESEDGTQLTITIDGCSVPAIAALASCFFTDVDTSEIQAATEALCQCSTPGCEENPPICAGEDADPSACEDCSNDDDDDDNGLTDCEDPNCRFDEVCQDTTTTSTTVTTTTTLDTTTTTTTDTTTTTLPSVEVPCTVTFSLEDKVTVGSLQWDTLYSGGEMNGSNAAVECTNLVAGALTAFNDDDANRTLSTGIINVSGFSGPTALAQCAFTAINAVPTSKNFNIQNVVATDPDLNDIEPTPDIVVSSIECDGPTTTTTTTLDTTTTTQDTTTTTVGDTTTTTIPDGPKNYNVVYKLETATAPVGSLQFDSSYASAPEFGFQGAAGTVSCTGNAAGALFAPNDNEAQKKLSLGFIAVSGFSAPTNLATCIYNGTAGDPPVPGDFPLSGVIATDTDFNDINVTLSVTVTAIP